MKNKFIILMGCTAVGKDTVLKAITELTDYTPIISYTTRPMRKGEIDDVDYHFIEREDFINSINNNNFIEYRSYNTLVNNIPDTWYYGIQKEEYNTNKIVILDLKGAKDFIEYYGKENVQVFYLSADNNTLMQRAKNRGDNIYEFERRLKDDLSHFTSKAKKSIGAIEIKAYDTLETLQSILERI